MNLLQKQSAFHAFSRTSTSIIRPQSSITACFTARYSTAVFIRIIIDTRAAERFTAGVSQFRALQNVQSVQLDKSRAEEIIITFGIGNTSSLGTAEVNTPIGRVTFHIMPADVPFLLYLQDLDRLRAKYDNLKDVLV